MPIYWDKKASILCLGLALAVFCVFSSVLKADFLNIDDDIFVQKNPHVKNGVTEDGLKWAFQADLLFDSPHVDYWQPIVVLSRLIDVQLWGMNPSGHHLTNLFFHALNAVLFFLLLFSFSGNRNLSFFAACIFAFHPVQTEAVSWIAARKDLLAAFFIFLTLHLYSRWAIENNRIRYAAAVTFYAFALMCKPSFILFPVFLFFWDVWPLKRPFNWRDKIGFFLCSAAFVALAFVISRKYMNNFEACDVLTGANFISYLQEILWPQKLWVCINLYPVNSFFHILGPAFVIAAFLFAFNLRKSSPWLLPAVALFVSAFVPAVTLPRACRFVYLPMAGFAVLISWTVGNFFKNRPERKIITGMGMALVVLLAFLSFRETGYWKDNETLFHRAIQLNPTDTAAWNNLGIFYLDQKDFERAHQCYLEVLRIQPDNPDAMNNMAVLYIRTGRYADAIGVLNKILSVHPEIAPAQNNMGFALMQLGRTSEALSFFKEALRLRPDFVKAMINYGDALFREGDYVSARAEYSKASHFKPRKKRIPSSSPSKPAS